MFSLIFKPNVGQTDLQVRFLTRASGIGLEKAEWISNYFCGKGPSKRTGKSRDGR
jgi:hypothetical protein